jgi:hypothetical protein
MRFSAVKIRLAAAALFLCVCAAFAQEALTNDSITKMAKGGLGDGVIIQMIQGQPGDYLITPDSVTSLKASGVSDQVIGAMLAKTRGANVVPPPSRTPSAASVNYDDLDTGVYYKVKSEWIAVPTEVVNWKTGGVLKSIATDGIVKGDINGHLKGSTSLTKVNSPLEFLIKAGDNFEATDYQLVRFHDKANQREFRTMTGGVFHSSGGASRDAVQFDAKKIAKRTYLLTLTSVTTPGEYGFLTPGLSNSTTSGSTGKAYTFRLVE